MTLFILIISIITGLLCVALITTELTLRLFCNTNLGELMQLIKETS